MSFINAIMIFIPSHIGNLTSKKTYFIVGVGDLPEGAFLVHWAYLPNLGFRYPPPFSIFTILSGNTLVVGIKKCPLNGKNMTIAMSL